MSHSDQLLIVIRVLVLLVTALTTVVRFRAKPDANDRAFTVLFAVVIAALAFFVLPRLDVIQQVVLSGAYTASSALESRRLLKVFRERAC